MKSIKNAFLGLAVGDALGVPVEFMSRTKIAENPVTGMLAYGSHKQPAGTWSDDSSLTFCLAHALCNNGYDLKAIANNFVLWHDHGFWTAHGEIFDVGISTSHSIGRIRDGVNPMLTGNVGEESNGNGSLMRIMPLAFYLKDKDIKKRFEMVSEVSAITHAHVRSILACFIYTEFVLQLWNGLDKMTAYRNMQQLVNELIKRCHLCDEQELLKFHRILENPYSDYEIKPIWDYTESEICSSGYVMCTLEASIWCFLKYDNYADAVLKAVNLGSDTDTTGCVTGGLAGLYYGSESIPTAWLEVLARREDIVDLAERLERVVE